MSDAREVPILFSAPMVRAILDDRKTETRRILKPQPGPDIEAVVVVPGGSVRFTEFSGGRWAEVRGLRWHVGDRLWVRESFSYEYDNKGERSDIWYWADGNPVDGDWTKPKPSIHMPRWASRITLEVTAVRVERLQKIDAGDCYAEGCPRPAGPILGSVVTERDNARRAYRELWCSINGPGSWDANPWVSVITFRRIANTPAIGGAAPQ